MRFLLSISIGPVQDFIAAARRTADLTAGSRLLTEVVGAAARTFDTDELIFPSKPDQRGANKLLAVVERAPRGAVDEAKAAAERAVLERWTTSLGQLRPAMIDCLDLARAEAQVGDFLEVYAAWVPLERDEDYGRRRDEVERLLAGRKALRAFAPEPASTGGVFISALDPTRGTVIKTRGFSVPAALREYPLFLKSTERLDAISLLKRATGRRLGDEDRTGAVPSTRALARRSLQPNYTDPPAQPDTDDDPETVRTEPAFPYYAILVADGDSMGRLLRTPPYDTVDAHRALASTLDGFADEAKEIIEGSNGHLVYSGGDDVLALLPVTTVIEAATLLAMAFEECLNGAASLSAGVAIVHYLEPLSVGLTRARAAEKEAKTIKNAISIALHTRGGSPVSVKQRWSEFSLEQWQTHYQKGRVPRGVAYELLQLAREWPDSAPVTALNAEVGRIIEKKLATAGGIAPAALKGDIPTFDAAKGLREFAELLVLARFLSAETLIERDEVA